MKSLLFLIHFLLITSSPLIAAEVKENEFLRRGTELFQAKKYDRAAKAFSQAARLDPDSAPAYKGLGMAYLKMGYMGSATNVEMVENAVSAFRQYLAIAPDSADIRYQLGLACLLIGDKAGAVRESQALQRLDGELAEKLGARIAAYQPVKAFTALPGGTVEGGSSTRVTISNNAVLVPTTLTHGGKTVHATLMLDTGAAVTLITKDLAKRLGLDLEKGEKRQFHLADGKTVEGVQIKVDSIAVGTRRKAGLDVSICATEGKFPNDGLLGMNFLRNFKHSIDFSNQVINWAR